MQENKGRSNDCGRREKGSRKRCQTVWIQQRGVDTTCQDSRAEGGKECVNIHEHGCWTSGVYTAAFLIWILTSLRNVMGKREEDVDEL